MGDNVFLNAARVQELWTAVKTQVGTRATLAQVTAALNTALANYMTSEETNAAISQGVADAANIEFKAVDTLPGTGEAKTVYLVPNGTEGSSVRDQYMYLDDVWVKLGDTAVDLGGCWAKDELRVMTAQELAAILV